MDPLVIAALSKVVINLIQSLRNAGWKPSPEELKSIKDQVDAAVANWDDAHGGD